MNPPPISVASIVRTFGEKRAIDDVSFQVHPGEVFGILGHNGAGKTTLVRLINGLLTSQSGQVLTFGMDPTRDGASVRARTGVLTEYPALDDFLTPEENLHVYSTIHGTEPALAQTRSRELLERLDLSEHLGLPARDLSAGLKQRLALARALIHDPELLLLDEPTSNLDPISARQVRDMVQGLSREHGRTVLLSTHNLEEAERLCDRVGILRNGRLLAIGTLAELGSSLGHGSVLLTVSENTIESATSALAGLGVTHPPVTIHGSTAQILAQLRTLDTPGVIERLIHAGVRISSVVPQAPTLEDIYIALHGPSVPSDDPASRQ